VRNALTTSTYHILTPYPGTRLYEQMKKDNRILHSNWELYDTRHVVYKTKGLNETELKLGYDWAYRSFYSWTNIWKASWRHDQLKHVIKHFSYAGGWKKFEPLWNFMIKTKGLNKMLPLLEAILSKVNNKKNQNTVHSPFPAIA
jgi:radical SAM superfamily enzyme YgiQ (UPF0313 family)